MKQGLPPLKKYIVLLLIVIMAAAFTSGCGDQQNTYAPPPPPEVTVDKPLVKTVNNYLYFTGNTRAAATVDIRARVEGYLESIHFAASSIVEKGTLLFVIDPRPYQAQLEEAKANLSVKKAELKLAEATLARKSNAFKARAVSEVEVLVARAQRDQAEAGVEAAFAAVETARLNLDYTTIRAPIEGVVNRNLVDVGNLVRAGEATLLTTIVDDVPIHAYFTVSEQDLLRLVAANRELIEEKKLEKRSADHPVYIGLANEEGYPHEGKLDYMDNRVDPETGTIEIRGVFPNTDHFIISGLFVRGRVPVGKIKDAMLVTERALGSDQRGRFLYVVGKDNKVEYRPVTIGPLLDGMRVILKGISPDDKVIVNGIQRARPGLEVKPIQAEPKKADSEQQPEESK